MRWGIPDSIATTAIDVCLEEVKRCNSISFGPSFFV
jgi:hypothetical protein